MTVDILITLIFMQ